MALYDMNPLDEEEERKKREAIAARMDEEAYANPVGPVEPSFFDAVGRGISNRFDQAMDRVSDVGNAFMDPQAALEQRMAQSAKQQEAADTEVQTQTVKTFGDGSQERVVKTQVPAGQQQAQQTQQAPMAGMTGPVAPNSPEAQQQAQEFARQMARFQQPRPNVAAEEQAQAQPQARTAQPQMQMQMPTGAMRPANYSLATGQGQPGIRMPQMAAPQAAAAPGASLAQLGQALGRQPAPQGTAFTPTVEREVAQPQPWVQAANDAGTDFYKLLDVANKNPESRDIIAEKIKSSFKQQTMKDEADAVMKAAQAGDLKAQNKILQSIKPETGKPREEVTVTDYLAAVLYKRMGLDALAQQKQAKILGKETKFDQITFGGSNWQVETDNTGNIIRAKDDEGNFATESTLAKLRAGGQKFGSQAFGFTGESAVIPTGQADAGQEYRQRTNSVSGAIENVITTGPNAGKIYGGPPGAAKSVGTSYSKALNQAFIDFQTKPTVEMAKKMMEIAGQVDDGSGRTINAVNDRIRQMTPGLFNQITSGAAGTPPAPTSATAPTQMPAATADSARLQRDLAAVDREISRLPANDPKTAQRRLILENERNTIQQQLGQGATAAPSAGGAPTAAPAAAGGGSLASQLKTQSEIAQEVGTDIGKIKANQSKTEQNADYLLTKINELVTHPGFSVSVGATVQPGFQFIPGTDKASWYTRFEEVKGQSFLQGIENLRGMGALSNQEGEAATKAVQRMSTSQSEAEFKAAARDFNEIIQRGVDRNREKLGQPLKYGTAQASETAKQTETKPAKLSAQDKQAIEWARQNPDDPRSAEIKKRLGL